MAAMALVALVGMLTLATVGVSSAKTIQQEPHIEARNGSLLFSLGTEEADATFHFGAPERNLSLRAMADKLAQLTTQLALELSTAKKEAAAQTSAAVASLNMTLQSEMTKLSAELSTERELRMASERAVASLQEQVHNLTQQDRALGAEINAAHSATVRIDDEIVVLRTVQTDLAEQVVGVKDGLEEADVSLATRISTLTMETGNISTATENLESALDDLGPQVDALKSTVLWRTEAKGQYSLRKIFDDLRKTGFKPGVHDCVMRTNNGAHWTGRRFTITVNYYFRPEKSSFPHRIYNIIDIEASSSGCSHGLKSFTPSDSETAVFDFHPGNCGQTLILACKPRWI